VFPLEELEEALKRHRPKLLGLVHAETSTGALQPIEALGALCRDHDCLLLVDTVTSLGGTPLFLDEWGVDAAYSGSQKCLNCPPGIAPVTFGPRAMAQLNQRKTPVANWYLDLSMVCNYWGKERTYHHTAPINMNYGLREALRLLAEEGLEPRWQRHRETVALLYEGLNDLGLTLHVEAPEHRIPALTTVRIPEGVDGKAVCQTLLNQYNIEIAGGLGELAGKVWRIGTMGFNARKENVLLLLSALKAVLHR
jgi:alanine-glyoxylate transaminase/serine-glyoxylate transaminase/serine-pyruvate transaminase